MSRWLPEAAVEAHLAKMAALATSQGRVKTVKIDAGPADIGERVLASQAERRAKGLHIGRPKGTKGPKQSGYFEPEATVLKSILGYLQAEKDRGKIRWFARMNTGAVPLDGGRFIRFGFNGCPDIVCQLADGRIGWIEVKSAPGRVSVAQAEFLSLVAGEHTLSGVARSLCDCRAILDGAK